ncbi:MAG: protoheme IX farnesyltransferase [Acidimicrobiia bacterium]|nr:MAG: protoheme IX farnesyltransferase [Acidimicrobiia bacterium]
MAAPAISSPTSIGAKLATSVGAYVALTKPRIIELLLVTTVPVMVVADQGVPPLWLMAAAVIGGTLAAGGANAINMYVDRDIDSVMERTQGRPLVTGAVSPRNALVFAVTIEVVAFVFLWQVVNLLSAVLAVSGCLYYVFIYTLWLKRSSRQNIVIGGAAGAVPVLVGWSAVTDTVSISAIVLFGVIFFWTPPHFWALAIKYKDDYARADVPMLPSVASHRQTTDQILAYTVVVWALTLLFGVTSEMGLLYWATAIVLGAVFTWMAVDLRRTESPARAIRVFTFSITYITVLFGVMALDVIIRNGW